MSPKRPARPGRQDTGEDRRHRAREPRAPVPRSRSGVVGRYFERTGDEPVTAQSALGLRLVLSTVFLPLFLAGTALFAYWTSRSGEGDTPSRDSLWTLTLICAGLALFACLDLAVVLLRRRRENPRNRRAPRRAGTRDTRGRREGPGRGGRENPGERGEAP